MRSASGIEYDAAVEWLPHAIHRGFVNYPFFAIHDRLLEPLCGDPRFSALRQDLRRRPTL